MSLLTFLQSLRPLTSGVLKVVTGNQSADMDSVCSAIAYAYFYHQKYPTEKPFIPLVNITKDELRLRRDIVLLLSLHRIVLDDLFFLDDLKNVSSLDVVLVDHCGLQGDVLTLLYEKNRLKVVSIIDHHADEGQFLDAEPRIIHSNGSCSSLVFNYWDSQLGVKEAELALLLLAPLVLDTTNMTQKVEEGDVTAFARYRQLLEGSGVLTGPLVLAKGQNLDTTLTTFYTTLKLAKKDLSGFLMTDILKKDYKLFGFTSANNKPVRAGFSSIGKGFQWILKKYSSEEIALAIETVMKTDDLDVMVLTTSYTNKTTKQYTREFCYTSNIAALEIIGEHAELLKLNKDIYDGKTVYAGLEKVSALRKIHLYNQVNTQALRKQVVPVVKSIIEATSV